MASHARKSEEQFRDEVREMTSRKSHCVPQQEVLERYAAAGGQVYGFLNLASIRLNDLVCDPVGRSVS